MIECMFINDNAALVLAQFLLGSSFEPPLHQKKKLEQQNRNWIGCLLSCNFCSVASISVLAS